MKTKCATMLLLLFGSMSLNSFGAPAEALAYYTDRELSLQNAHVAGLLDFSLSANEWDPADVAGAMTPGQTITRHMSIVAEGNLPFQHSIATIKTDGDDAFCGTLEIVAMYENAELYSGALMNFAAISSATINAGETGEWTFVVTLPPGSGPFDGASCEFNFEVDGWQSGFPDSSLGFSNHESLENILESALTLVEEQMATLSPLADAYIEEQHPAANNGNSDDLKIASRVGGKNKRSFIRFDFDFPAITSIQSGMLKVFLGDAPVASRTYGLARALTPWSETSITWNNQPTLASPETASTTTGTTDNAWLSWDVVDDIADFVSGVFQNNGWGLFDIAENSGTNQEGIFFSRNDDNQDGRPVLEVTFSAPPATTTHMVINEVYKDVSADKGADGTNEWIELYNPTDVAIDIKNWQVCDASSCDTLATTSPTISIPSHGFAVLTSTTSTWTHWTLPAGVVHIVIGSLIGGGLANAGDAVILKDASSVEIDAMSYGTNVSKLSPAVPISGDGNSLARTIKGYDADLATDWIKNATPNPGTNPSDSGTEIMRFTERGIEVADYRTGLVPLPLAETNPMPENIPKEVVPLPDLAPTEEAAGVTEENKVETILPAVPVFEEPATPPAETPTTAETTPEELPNEPLAAEAILPEETVEKPPPAEENPEDKTDEPSEAGKSTTETAPTEESKDAPAADTTI